MAGPLLETKFHVPRRGRGLVARSRLSERLSRGADSALTLVSAPAGFGKTTLLAEWLAVLAAEGRAVAWLSLDQRDNEPGMFWTYLVAALKTVAPGVGAEALSLLQSPQSPIEGVLATLLNDLDAIPNDVVLVLDDYHLIDAREVQDGIAFLVDHLPPQVHLVIAGRADPTLPLARLRSRGELVEIRSADLRFTPDEAATYLNDAMGLALTAPDVAALEGRTEGWIAALQLAALSMQGRDDIAGFIAGFAGDDRYIVDYLAEEVLQRQPEDVRHFLLRTSILDRLTGALCDAVTGQDGGKAMLVALERENLFLVPLDDRRRWYRYHQLFKDVLQAHLLDEEPDDGAGLHRRASVWFEQNGEPADAVRHALAAEDFERAADLVEPQIPAMARSRQEATVRRWLAALPDDVVRVRPVLSVGFAGVLLAVGELEGGVEARLRDAERWLETAGTGQGSPLVERRETPSAEMVVVDDEQFRRLPVMIELYRAALALAVGDIAAAVTHSQQAFDLSADEEYLSRAAARGLSGLAYWASGDLEAGHSAYTDCMAGLYLAGYVSDTFGCAIALADIRLAQGRLGEALHTYEQALRRATEHGRPVLRGTADMYVGMSEVLRERDDLPAATEHLQRCQELADDRGLPQNPYRRRVAMGRILQAQGDLDATLDLLDEAERLYVSDFFPNVRPVPALRARVFLAQGRWGDALGWARERGLSAEDELSYLHEFEHITLARALVTRYAADRDDRDIERATLLLSRLLRAADDGGRTGSVIEILVVQALAEQARGDIPTALGSLRRALTLSEPEGYVRIYVDEGPSIAPLLRAAAKQGTSGYVRQLLAALNRSTETAVAGTTPERGLIEPLSARELDVLRLLATDLDGPDIARELIVSLNTVRTHTKHIYEKLGVNNRRAAIRRAKDLDMLSRAGDR